MTPESAGALAVQNQVIEEIRVWLARRRLSARQAAFQLGWTQGYIAKRMTGRQPFDVADLAALAELLEVPVSAFFPDLEPGPRMGKATVPSSPVALRRITSCSSAVLVSAA